MADLDNSSTFHLTLFYPSQPNLFKEFILKKEWTGFRAFTEIGGGIFLPL